MNIGPIASSCLLQQSPRRITGLSILSTTIIVTNPVLAPICTNVPTFLTINNGFSACFGNIDPCCKCSNKIVYLMRYLAQIDITRHCASVEDCKHIFRYRPSYMSTRDPLAYTEHCMKYPGVLYLRYILVNAPDFVMVYSPYFSLRQ